MDGLNLSKNFIGAEIFNMFDVQNSITNTFEEMSTPRSNMPSPTI